MASDHADGTQGLYSWVEDNITRPYTLPVLIAKIQTVMRRLQKTSKPGNGLLSYQGHINNLKQPR